METEQSKNLTCKSCLQHTQTDTPNILDKLHIVIAKQKFMEVAISLTTGEQADGYSEDVYLGCQVIMGEIANDLDDIAGLLEKN